jgi:hypothetical protein
MSNEYSGKIYQYYRDQKLTTKGSGFPKPNVYHNAIEGKSSLRISDGEGSIEWFVWLNGTWNRMSSQDVEKRIGDLSYTPQHSNKADQPDIETPLWVVAVYCPLTSPPSIHCFDTESQAQRYADEMDERLERSGNSKHRVLWGPVTTPPQSKKTN